jgi:hypothetical protein
MGIKLWPLKPPGQVHGMADVVIYARDDSDGKPVVEVTVGGQTLMLTASVAEMIGGAAKGARLRWEDHNGGRVM